MTVTGLCRALFATCRWHPHENFLIQRVPHPGIILRLSDILRYQKVPHHTMVSMMLDSVGKPSFLKVRLLA